MSLCTSCDSRGGEQARVAVWTTSPSATTSSAPRTAILGSLLDWLTVPSISADPAHAADVANSAEFCAGLMRAAGLKDVETLSAGGVRRSTATGWTPAPAPTVLVYGHHDVQPVDPLDEWTSPPFEPVVVDGDAPGPGRQRRQGPGPDADRGGPRPARGARPLARQLEVPDRRRRGGRQPPLRGPARSREGKARHRRHRCVRHHHGRARYPVDHASACVASSVSTSPCERPSPTSTAGSGEGRSPTPPSWPPGWRPASTTPTTAVTVPGFYDRVRELSAKRRLARLSTLRRAGVLPPGRRNLPRGRSRPHRLTNAPVPARRPRSSVSTPATAARG